MLRYSALLLLGAMLLTAPAPVTAESLQAEFDRLCVHTQDAENLSLAELEKLVGDCDRLKEKIAASDDRRKKVMLFRLEKCRNFFAYMIALKKSGG